MVGGAVGAVSAIDRLDHLTDLKGRVVCGAPRNQLCPPADSTRREARQSAPAKQARSPALGTRRVCSTTRQRVQSARQARVQTAVRCVPLGGGLLAAEHAAGTARGAAAADLRDDVLPGEKLADFDTDADACLLLESSRNFGVATFEFR